MKKNLFLVVLAMLMAVPMNGKTYKTPQDYANPKGLMISGITNLKTKCIESKTIKVKYGALQYSPSVGRATTSNVSYTGEFALLEGVASSGQVWYNNNNNILVLEDATITSNNGMKNGETLRLPEGTQVVVSGNCTLSQTASNIVVDMGRSVRFFDGYIFNPKKKTNRMAILNVNAPGVYAAFKTDLALFYGITIFANAQTIFLRGGYASLYFESCNVSNKQAGKLFEGYSTSASITSKNCGLDKAAFSNRNRLTVFSFYAGEMVQMRLMENCLDDGIYVKNATAYTIGNMKITSVANSYIVMDIDNSSSNKTNTFTDDNDKKFWAPKVNREVKLPYEINGNNTVPYYFTTLKLKSPFSTQPHAAIEIKPSGLQSGQMYWIPSENTLYVKNINFKADNNPWLRDLVGKRINIMVEGQNTVGSRGNAIHCKENVNISGVTPNSKLVLNSSGGNGITAAYISLKNFILYANANNVGLFTERAGIDLTNMECVLNSTEAVSLRVMKKADIRNMFNAVKCGVKRTAENNNLTFNSTLGIFQLNKKDVKKLEIVRSNYMEVRATSESDWTMKKALEDEKKPKPQIAM